MAIKDSNHWTQEDEEILRRLVLTNTPPFEIARVLGRTVSAVKTRARSLGLRIAFGELDGS
jgi:hypothetical protein